MRYSIYGIELCTLNPKTKNLTTLHPNLLETMEKRVCNAMVTHLLLYDVYHWDSRYIDPRETIHWAHPNYAGTLRHIYI